MRKPDILLLTLTERFLNNCSSVCCYGHFIHSTQSAKQQSEILTHQKVTQAQWTLLTQHRLQYKTHSLFPGCQHSPVIPVAGWGIAHHPAGFKEPCCSHPSSDRTPKATVPVCSSQALPITLWSLRCPHWWVTHAPAQWGSAPKNPCQ